MKEVLKINHHHSKVGTATLCQKILADVIYHRLKIRGRDRCSFPILGPGNAVRMAELAFFQLKFARRNKIVFSQIMTIKKMFLF